MTAAQSALVWLHAKVAALFAALGDVISNRPEPAGAVVIRTLAAIGGIWLALMIARKVKK